MPSKKNRDLEPGDRVNVVMVVSELHKTAQGTTILFDGGYRLFQAINVMVDVTNAPKTPSDPLNTNPIQPSLVTAVPMAGP